MKRLFLIEYEKLRANRSSRILIGAYFILLTSIALIAAIKFDIGPIKFHLAEQGIFNFPYIWHFNAYIGAWFKIFLAVVIVSMTANEYSNKTIKQNLIDGLSKREFLHSKWVMLFSFAAVSTLFIFCGIPYSRTDLFKLQRILHHCARLGIPGRIFHQTNGFFWLLFVFGNSH